MITVEHYTITRCNTCGRELKSAIDLSLCRRTHTLEYWNSTQEGIRMMQMLRDAEFKDQPDPWLRAGFNTGEEHGAD